MIARVAVAKPVAAPQPSSLVLARKCDCGNHTPGGGTCASCAEAEKKRRISRVMDPAAAATLARSPHAASSAADATATAASASASAVPPIVHDVLRGSGQRLPSDVRSFMEPRFGTDFSDVRVHTDGAAAQSSRAVGAHAYTVGPHIVFNTGRFQPASASGRRLLAHELTHVVQQRSAASHDAPDRISDPADASEHEADVTADRVLGSAPRANTSSSSASSWAPSTWSPPPRIAQPGTGIQRELSKEEKWGIAGGIVGGIGATLVILWQTGVFDKETFSPDKLVEYLNGLAKRRTPEGDRDSDNKARDVVRKWEAGDKRIDVDKGHQSPDGALTSVSLKRLLIREMLDGTTAGADEEAILTILRRSTPEDVLELLDPAKGVSIQKLDDKIGGDNHDKFEAILEEKFPKDSKVRAQEHRSASCTARQGLMLARAQQTAVTWVENAIMALQRFEDLGVKQALDCRFPGTKGRQRLEIFQVFEKTLQKLPTRRYFCGKESGESALEPTVLISSDGRKMEAECVVEDADSFAKGGETTHPEVFLCMSFFKREPWQQALTIVHEAVHAAGLLGDPAYQPGCGLKLETALQNPDSYAYLASDLMTMTGETANEEAKKSLPNVTVGNFRNKGAVSEENESEVGQQIPGLGLDQNTGLNMMELRGDISGKAEKVQFDFRRTKEQGIWRKANGAWTRVHHSGPGKDDDRLNRDEDLSPKNNHIYSIDGPGLDDLTQPLGPEHTPGADEAVYRASFLESVEARVPPAGWTRVSNEFAWHTITWLVRPPSGGPWERKPGKSEIEAGPLTIGNEPPEPAAPLPATSPQNAPATGSTGTTSPSGTSGQTPTQTPTPTPPQTPPSEEKKP